MNVKRQTSKYDVTTAVTMSEQSLYEQNNCGLTEHYEGKHGYEY